MLTKVESKIPLCSTSAFPSVYYLLVGGEGTCWSWIPCGADSEINITVLKQLYSTLQGSFCYPFYKCSRQINRILPLLGYTVFSTYCQGRELLTLVKIINGLEYDRWHFDGFWLDFSAWLYSWKTPQSLVRYMVRKFELAVKLDLIGFHSFAWLPDLTINFS